MIYAKSEQICVMQRDDEALIAIPDGMKSELAVWST